MVITQKTDTSRALVTLIGADVARMNFVARAMSTDKTRYFMTCVHVEHEDPDTIIAIATDGRRLHFAYLDIDVPDGDYNVLKANKSTFILQPIDTGGQFPNWRKVTPDRLECSRFMDRSANHSNGTYDISDTEPFTFGFDVKKRGIGLPVGQVIGAFTLETRDAIGEREMILNANFVSDLIGFAWTLYVGKKSALFVSETGRCTAVIAGALYD